MRPTLQIERRRKTNGRFSRGLSQRNATAMSHVSILQFIDIERITLKFARVWRLPVYTFAWCFAANPKMHLNL